MPEKGQLRPLSQPCEVYLDLARVFATNIVVVGHVLLLYKFLPPTSLGSTGVVVFFLLSG